MSAEAYIPLSVLAVAFVVIVILWIASARFRDIVEKVRPLLDLLAICAALSVFVQLYYSIEQFETSQADERRAQESRLAAQLSALELELETDIVAATRILEGTKFNDNTHAMNAFHFDATAHVLKHGLLLQRPHQVALSNAHHWMLLTNQTIDARTQLLFLQPLLPSTPDASLRNKARLAQAEEFVESGSRKAKTYLEQARAGVRAERSQRVTSPSAGDQAEALNP